MRYLKKFSWRALIGQFGNVYRRFPIAMLLMTFLTCFLIYRSHDGDLGEKMNFFLIFYPASGALLAVAISLFTEDFRNWRVSVPIQVIAQGLWLAVSYYLAQFDRFSMPQWAAVAATVVAMVLAVFLVCFYRKNHDVPFWNFSIRTLLGLAIAFAIGGVLTLGLFALVESMKMLFGLNINYRVFQDIAAVCMVALAPALFMNLIPKRDNKYVMTVTEFPPFAKGVVQYLFLPLLGAYMITLYAYAIKILMQWTLPVGGVSYLVTGSMVFMVLLIYITYPVQHLDGNKLFKVVTRWLPVAMFPLLALMSVAIGRRLSDYGITVSRLYLLVFNVWCYAVCLWLIATRTRRIWLIPASFALVLLLISVGPQSICNVTERQLKKEALTAFAASGIRELPLSGERYEQWLHQCDPQVARSIDAKLNYLSDYYGYDFVSDLLSKDAITGLYTSQEGQEETADAGITYSNDRMIQNASVPQGYGKMSIVNINDDNITRSEGKTIWIEATGPDKKAHQFEIRSQQFAEMDMDKNSDGPCRPFIIGDGEALLVIDDFHVRVSTQGIGYLNCSGIMFTK